MNLLPMDKFY